MTLFGTQEKYQSCTLSDKAANLETNCLTLSQTSNFRPFQTERVCRRQF